MIIGQVHITSADNVQSFRAFGRYDGLEYCGHNSTTPMGAVSSLIARIAIYLQPGRCQRCGRGEVHYHCKRCSKYICGHCRARQIGSSTRQAVCVSCLVAKNEFLRAYADADGAIIIEDGAVVS